MRLKLSIWAEDLVRSGSASAGRPPNPYGVISVLSPKPGTPPRVLGRTETLHRTSSPDWTKFFVVEDFQLGQPYNVSVSVYDDDDDNPASGGAQPTSARRLLCSTLLELGHVLGAPGGTVGKECSVGGGGGNGGGSGAAGSGTILVLQVEPSHADLGMFHFHVGAASSTSASAYFELQRLRQSVRTGARVWDCVFRSRSKEPIGGGVGGGAAANQRTWWDESFVELDELCGGDLRETFRIAVFESFDSSSSPALRGECRCSIQDLTAKALKAGERTSSALSKVGTDRAFELKREDGTAAGYLWVALAEVLLDGSAPTPVEVPEAERRQRQIDFATNEGEIYVASSSEELVVDPYGGSDGRVEPTFVNFIRGGCQLHVVAAVDATASNGDPRKDASLHCFNPSNGQPNAYERALEALCTILSQYDSDQRYPVFGFGARPKGGAVVSHCFPLHPGRPAVGGVQGILQAYRDAFRSGIVMSSPRDYAAMIETAAAQARSELQNGPQQAYSVLLIFTNGPPVDTNKTIAAIRQAEADPLSIVIVGIGGADFSSLHQSLAASGVQRDMVRFVPYQNEASSSYALTSAALDPIPAQLEAYFASRGIRPNPPVAAEEIVVEPYRPEPSAVYQVPVAGGSMTASPSKSYSPVPVVSGSVYNPNAAASSSFSSSGTSIPMATVVTHPPSSSMPANTVPVATGVPINAATHPSSTTPHPFSASLATPAAAQAAAPAPPASSVTPSHTGNTTTNSTNNEDDTMKGLGKKLMNSRIGKQAVGRLKGQAKAKINRFVKQKIGFGIL